MESNPMNQPPVPPILDRAILDTTSEYPIVYNAILHDGELHVARIVIDHPEHPAIWQEAGCTSFVLTQPGEGDRPDTRLAVATQSTALLGTDTMLHSWMVIGTDGPAVTIAPWPITMGTIQDGGLWCMIACPADTTLKLGETR